VLFLVQGLAAGQVAGQMPGGGSLGQDQGMQLIEEHDQSLPHPDQNQECRCLVHLGHLGILPRKGPAGLGPGLDQDWLEDPAREEQALGKVEALLLHSPAGHTGDYPVLEAQWN
jgi:hypothetical protein